MRVYLLHRFTQSLLVLFGVSFVVFLILHLTGDPALVLLPPDATPEDVRRFREAWGSTTRSWSSTGVSWPARSGATSGNRSVTESPRSTW